MARHRVQLTDAQWAKTEPLLPTFKRSLKGGRKPVAGAFELRIESAGRALRLIERLANARSRWLQMPYGDQALFATFSIDCCRAGHCYASGVPS